MLLHLLSLSLLMLKKNNSYFAKLLKRIKTRLVNNLINGNSYHYNHIQLQVDIYMTVSLPG
jgi:hypothetical protein